MYAIIESGGKQYKVAQGDVIFVEKLATEIGQELSFDCLLVVGDGTFKVGNPVVENATVTAVVRAQVKGEKIRIFTYKAKKNVRKRAGHRQPYTRLEILAVNA